METLRDSPTGTVTFLFTAGQRRRSQRPPPRHIRGNCLVGVLALDAAATAVVGTR
ncbi:MAG TPA: hypothetical protein VG478_13980 [Acidimicrobiales bacterium]|nr:hypothetical protein [Acidimicrobiales bacterium]